MVPRTSTDNIIQFVYGDDRVDPAKSDHGNAVNVKNIFLKTQNLNQYLDHEKDYRDREITRLKEDGELTKELKEKFDLLENFQTEFDADKAQPKPKKSAKKATKKKSTKKKTTVVKPKAKKSAKKATKKKTSKKATKTKKTSKPKYNEEYFQNLYNEETGKTAEWRGSITKLYTKWLEKKKEELGVK